MGQVIEDEKHHCENELPDSKTCRKSRRKWFRDKDLLPIDSNTLLQCSCGKIYRYYAYSDGEAFTDWWSWDKSQLSHVHGWGGEDTIKRRA